MEPWSVKPDKNGRKLELLAYQYLYYTIFIVIGMQNINTNAHLNKDE